MSGKQCTAQLTSRPTRTAHPRTSSFFSCISFNTLSATLKASMPAGIPQYALFSKISVLFCFPTHRFNSRERGTHEACNKASRISTSVAPFLTAPLTCVPNSIHFPNAVNITKFSRLLSLRLNPGRVQIVPQALSYIRQPLPGTLDLEDGIQGEGEEIQWQTAVAAS
jgi:hypothetical protein